MGSSAAHGLLPPTSFEGARLCPPTLTRLRVTRSPLVRQRRARVLRVCSQAYEDRASGSDEGLRLPASLLPLGCRKLTAVTVPPAHCIRVATSWLSLTTFSLRNLSPLYLATVSRLAAPDAVWLRLLAQEHKRNFTKAYHETFEIIAERMHDNDDFDDSYRCMRTPRADSLAAATGARCCVAGCGPLARVAQRSDA